MSAVVAPNKENRFVRLEPKSAGQYAIDSFAGLDRPVYALAAGGSELFALAPNPGATRDFIYRLSSRGEVVSAFGRAETIAPPTATLDLLTSSSLLWSTNAGELAFVSAYPYAAQFYGRTGRLARSVERRDSDFRPEPAQGLSESRVRERDRVMGAVELPSGNFVAFVLKQRVGGSRAYLEVLDREFRPIAPELSTGSDGGYGRLAGASRDGALYFAKITPYEGVNLVKASLVRTSVGSR